MHPDALSRLKASYSNGQLWTNHVKLGHVDPVSPEYICDLLFAALEIPGDDQAAIIDQLFSRRGPLVVPKRTSDALKRLGKGLNRSAKIAAYLATHYRRNFEQEVALLQAERFKENRDRAIEVQLPTGPEGALEKRVLLFHDKYGNQVHQQAMADYICRWVEKEYPLLSSADKAADSQMIRGANGNAIAARLRQLSSKHAHDRSEQELVAKWKLVGIDAECFLATPSNQKPAHRVLSAIFHPKSELIGAYRADGNIFWERLSVRYKGTDLNIPRQTSLAQVIKEMLKFPPEGREEAWIKERQQSLLAQLEQAIQTLVNNGSPEPSVDTLQRALKAGSSKRSSFEQFISRVRCLSSRQKEFEHLAEIARKFHARGTFVSRFRHARKLKRHFIFRLGPTNSGKTHAALQAMAKARSGVYLAPLRLLALEKQEELLSLGICTSLVTGEERDLRKGTHICQTIEMLDIRTPYEVAVIDEAQMLRDPDRGWAWTNAICGVVAPTIYVTGAEYIQNMLIGLVESCGDTWETIKTERNGSLTLTSPSEWPKISPNSAIVAFGRQTVLAAC